ncbi:Hsp20/alpha crystallin family protein [Candidatus Peregrinibacteria bacterium]|nr:MAG: Hsp20/alpha crystallin family protein [Candidatus Peregrinibacteria bacterium]
MTQIGIGQLKHAKKADDKVQLRLNARAHPTPAKAEEQEPEEGQLSVDILHTENEMVVLCPIAGVEKTDVRVSLQDDVLTIRGERKPVSGLDLHKTLVGELFWGTFSRSIVLPDHIDRKNVQARVHEHVLIITIPKTEDYKTRIIHVSADE